VKLFAGIAISVSVLMSSDEVVRPEAIFKTGTEYRFSGTIDFPKEKSRSYGSFFKVTDVVRNGDNWSCNATMTYLFNNVPQKSAYLFQFACDTVNFYVSTTNFAFRDVEKVKHGSDEATGDSLVYPLKMKVGDTLPDAWCKTAYDIAEGSSSYFISCSKRKVERLDTLNLSCGKIPAYRITMTKTSTSKVNSGYSGKRELKQTVIVTEWFSPKLGIVKEEERSNESTSTVILESFKEH
jgi:hypothetical protein